jgi:hypothetical protein
MMIPIVERRIPKTPNTMVLRISISEVWSEGMLITLGAYVETTRAFVWTGVANAEELDWDIIVI